MRRHGGDSDLAPAGGGIRETGGPGPCARVLRRGVETHGPGEYVGDRGLTS